MTDLKLFLKIFKRHWKVYVWFLIFLLAFTFFWGAFKKQNKNAYTDIEVKMDIAVVSDYWRTQAFFLKPNQVVDMIAAWLKSPVVVGEIYSTVAAEQRDFIIIQKEPQLLSFRYEVRNEGEAGAIFEAARNIIENKLSKTQANISPLPYSLSFGGPVIKARSFNVVERLFTALGIGVLAIILVNGLVFIKNS